MERWRDGGEEGGVKRYNENMCYHHKGVVSFKRLPSLPIPSGSNRLCLPELLLYCHLLSISISFALAFSRSFAPSLCQFLALTDSLSLPLSQASGANLNSAILASIVRTIIKRVWCWHCWWWTNNKVKPLCQEFICPCRGIHQQQHSCIVSHSACTITSVATLFSQQRFSIVWMHCKAPELPITNMNAASHLQY